VPAEIKAKLLEAGKDEGCISLSLLNELTPDDEDPNTIDELFDFLTENNIEVISHDKTGAKKTLDGKLWEESSKKYMPLDDEVVDPDKPNKTSEICSKDDESQEAEETTTTYLREMGRFDLLTPEEEEKYSRAIREGFDGIINSIKDNEALAAEMKLITATIAIWEKRDPTLKPKKQHLNYMVKSVAKANEKHPEVPELSGINIKVAKYGDAIEVAKDAMIKANLRLVVSIAKRYMHQGLSLADLIQEGNLGLMRAVFRFDYTKGNKFSTYASWWIRQAITRAILDKTRTIRLPVHFLELRSQFFKAFYSLLKELGREPTPVEISEKTGLPMDKILAILEASREPISLETPVGDDDSTLGDFLENQESVSPYEAVKNQELADRVTSILATLSPREEKIIRLRFGIGEDAEFTLEEIGKRFNVSRERIRQIEKKALNRLRHSSRREKLKHFLD